MFNLLAINNAINFVNSFNKKIKVLDLGCQTYDKVNKLENILSHKLLTYDQKNSFQNLLKKKNLTTKDFYLALGCLKYESIDINGDLDSYSFDLNYNLVDEYKFNNSYDFVINNGTSEHLFNQFSFFKNTHELCEKNGLMMHIVPFIGYVNHAFYNYPPLFFIDLASSNNYQIMKISFCNRDGSEIIIDQDKYVSICDQIKPNDIYKKTFIYKVIEFTRNKIGENFFILTVFKKINNNKFITPLQGKYLSDIKNNTHIKKYKDQNPGSQLAKGQLADKKLRQ